MKNALKQKVLVATPFSLCYGAKLKIVLLIWLFVYIFLAENKTIRTEKETLLILCQLWNHGLSGKPEIYFEAARPRGLENQQPHFRNKVEPRGERWNKIDCFLQVQRSNLFQRPQTIQKALWCQIRMNCWSEARRGKLWYTTSNH